MRQVYAASIKQTHALLFIYKLDDFSGIEFLNYLPKEKSVPVRFDQYQ
jgi:hypothetical protein